jgi:ribose-phosphate pyrophosphokinase
MPPTLPSNLRLFAPAFGAALGARVAEVLGIRLGSIEERDFDGGEQKMRPLEDVGGCDVFVVASLDGDATLSANDKLCRLLFFIGALKDAGAARVTACVPYLCYARKDRRTNPGDPITTRYVAAMFEAVGTDCVVTIDVHNEAAFDNAFRCRTVRIESAELFAAALIDAVDTERCVVVSPDIGGVKRAQRLREALAHSFEHEVGFAFMEKRRVGGVVSGDALIGEVTGRDLVILDDMIVSGGTIARATRAARAAGAHKVVVAAAHAPLTAEARQLLEDGGPDSILISDSVALPKAFASAAQFRICSCADVLATTIRQLATRC